MSRSSSASTLPDDRNGDHQPFFSSVERRISLSEHYAEPYLDYLTTSSRSASRALAIADDAVDDTGDLPQPFYVIKEDGIRTSTLWNDTSTPKVSCNGPAICATGREDLEAHPALAKDERAADMVETHIAEYRRRNRDSTHERILKSLICPRSPEAEFEIDDAALQGIFCAANELFFRGCLEGRVTWTWSFYASSRFEDEAIAGTTAVREARDGGYETRIMLSSQILKSKRYNRRLLISTFLHELIHSYLFVCCGFEARRCGGHTSGFHRIAKLIDDWVGPGILHLYKIEADLGDFEAIPVTSHHNVYHTDYAAPFIPTNNSGTTRLAPISNAGGLPYVYWTERTHEI